MRPITWVELYILYRTRGYDKPIAKTDNIAKAGANVDKQLKRFKLLIRATTTRTLAGTDQLRHFRPAKNIKDNLVGIGISGNHQGPAFNVRVSENEQNEIAKRLHKLNHTITEDKWNGILDGKI